MYVCVHVCGCVSDAFWTLPDESTHALPELILSQSSGIFRVNACYGIQWNEDLHATGLIASAQPTLGVL